MRSLFFFHMLPNVRNILFKCFIFSHTTRSPLMRLMLLIPAFLLPVILAGMACRFTIDAGFVSDDFVLIHTVKQQNFLNLITGNWLGCTGCGGFYRPIIQVFIKLDYLLHGLDARGYHMTNATFHILNTFIVGLLILRLQKDTLDGISNRDSVCRPSGAHRGDCMDFRSNRPCSRIFLSH